jgi:hypothetical protein
MRRTSRHTAPTAQAHLTRVPLTTSEFRVWLAQVLKPQTKSPSTVVTSCVVRRRDIRDCQLGPVPR